MVRTLFASRKSLLIADALTCAGLGIFLCMAYTPVAGLTGLDPQLLFVAGSALLPIAAFMLLTALLWEANRLPLLLIVVGNLAWVAASIAVIVATPFLTPLGWIFIAAQASVVAVLAYAEFRLLTGGNAILA